MNDSFFVLIEDGVLRARIRGRWDQMHANVLHAVKRLAIGLQGYVKEDKLSGQVLHTITGTLRRSINQEVIDGGDTITAIVGTNIVYAHPHEYGFEGDVRVRAHERQSASGKMSLVREHMRHMLLPERSFLRSSLTEWQGRIRQEIQAAARDSL